jgi:hypothetical protein
MLALIERLLLPPSALDPESHVLPRLHLGSHGLRQRRGIGRLALLVIGLQ